MYSSKGSIGTSDLRASSIMTETSRINNTAFMSEHKNEVEKSNKINMLKQMIEDSIGDH